MLEFPIKEIYRRMAWFDVMDRDSTVGAGCGFFYLYDDKAFLTTNIFFVTKRSFVAIEEKGFLPDSIILHMPSDSGNAIDIPLELYDKQGRPVWRVLLQESEQVLISILVSDTTQVNYAQCFLSEYGLPSQVHLKIHDGILNVPVQACFSVAEYIFYSNSKNERTLQNMIEKGDGFKINRKGFARDMIEMVLVLLQQNLDKLAEFEKEPKNGKAAESYLALHGELVSELEKIMIQFGDVLEPSLFEKIQNIFAILKEHGLEDYLAARHLIRKVLLQLGQNVVFAQ